MSAQAKTYEQKLGDLVRLLASEHDGEVIATAHALKRLLASRDADFNDLANAIEQLATGGLEEAALKRVFEAGRQKEREEIARARAESESAFGLKPDGTKDWEGIALYVQREKARLDPRHHQFVDDMAGRMTWGREPSERQGQYLISFFRQLGGRIA
jgi:hypothetical protein